MATRLRRSVDQPIREGLTWGDKWRGPDEGLIWCWERGRQERLERPKDAERADRGELVGLDWRGGVKKKLKAEKALGTLKYLATWQGLRGEDLDIDLEAERAIVCSRTGQVVVFSARLPEDVEEE
ncbi:MAG: hypothetical protein ABSH05_22225 [Bryobacteraceae bacterium]|jgi:hypothetical protein